MSTEKFQEITPSTFKGSRFPVESIEWEQIIEFCNILNKGKKKHS